MTTLTHYLNQNIAGQINAQSGVWVRINNNATGVDYVSTSATDVNGMFTITAPAGIYTVFTGPSSVSTPTATGNTNFVVPNDVPNFNVMDYGAIGNGTIDDTVAINNAIAAALTVGSGIVWLPSGTYKVTNLTKITKPGVSFLGVGTTAVTLKAITSTGDTLAVQMNPFTVNQAGRYGGFTIDGTSASAGTNGLHYGDVIGGHLDDLSIQNYTGAGSVGLFGDNRTNWTERTLFTRVWVGNCTTNVKFDVHGGQTSWGYTRVLDLRLNVNANQNGVVFDNSAQFYNSTLNVLGNFGNSSNFMTLQGNSSVLNTTYSVQAELASGTANGLTINSGSTLSGHGLISLILGNPTNVNNGTINFSGVMRANGIYSSATLIGFGGVGVEPTLGQNAPNNYGLWSDGSSLFAFATGSVVFRPGGSGVATGQVVVTTAGKILVVAGAGLDTATAGALHIGQTSATSILLDKATTVNGPASGNDFIVQNNGNPIEIVDVESNAVTHRFQPPVAVATINSDAAILTLLDAPYGAANTSFVDWKLSYDGSGNAVSHLLSDSTGTHKAANIFTTEIDPHAQSTNAEFEIIRGTFRGSGGTQMLDIQQSIGVTALEQSKIAINSLKVGPNGAGADITFILHDSSSRTLLTRQTGANADFVIRNTGTGRIVLRPNDAAGNDFAISSSGVAQGSAQIYPGLPTGGIQGAAGILGGTGAPNNANGNNGDFYFRSDGGAGTSVYMKRAGAWVGVV